MRTVDVAVIGGGPAGATVATLCALNGLDVELYEREHGPRYRIGESLLPATPRQLLPLLGVGEEIGRADFVVKPGVTFSWGNRPDMPWDLFFQGATALNVDRKRFDAILLENARAKGVSVRKGEAVVSVGEGDSDRGREVEIAGPNDTGRRRVLARYVVDASGQMRFRLPELRARTHSRFFRKVALWGYWENAVQVRSALDGKVLFETLGTEHGPAWLWAIPLSGTLVSVGAVAPRECARALRGDRRAVLNDWVAKCPRTAALLAGARPATAPPYREVRTCADYSYASDAFWAPGLVRVGDAACFADVLLSSGVHLATYGALLAARSIEAVLRRRMSEPLAMDEYESRTRQEFSIFYAGISGLYDMSRPRDHYVQPLRDVLSHSNGVYMEAGEFPGVQAGLNIERVKHPQLAPEHEAARNVRTMREWNRRALLYDGLPRNVPIGELPAIRNALTVSPDGRGWRLPGRSASGAASGPEVTTRP